jgi:NitT/TauT family transport system substrate-binding protein
VISRRDALTVLGGSLAALGVTGARAAEPLTLLHVGVIPIYSVAQHYAADAQGYFAAEGIAVTSQPVQGGVIGIPGLISGSFDVLYSNAISVLTALERGIDLRIIAEGTPIPAKPPDADALFKRKGEDIRSGKDLEGKVIGINTRFTAQWLVMQGWVKKTGGDLNKITYREVPLPSMLDALKSKQVDVALLLDPFMSIAFADPNYELLGWPSSIVLPNLPSSLWVVSGTFADAKPELVSAYLRAYLKGVAWVNANLGKPAYLNLVASFTKTDPNQLAKMYTAGQLTEIDVDAIKGLVSVMREYDLLKSDVEISSKIFKATAPSRDR